MPWWQWLVDVVGVVLLLVVLYAVALVFRRRWISRAGGTFDLSLRSGDLRPGRGWVLGVVFAPDGQTLVSASADNTARIWRVGDGTPLRTLQGHTGWVVSRADDERVVDCAGAEGERGALHSAARTGRDRCTRDTAVARRLIRCG